MPIQQKLPPPVLLFSEFAGWISREGKKQYSNFKDFLCKNSCLTHELFSCENPKDIKCGFKHLLAGILVLPADAKFSSFVKKFFFATYETLLTNLSQIGMT